MRLLFFILLLIPLASGAQSWYELKEKQISDRDSLPPGIRSGKSLVLLEVDNGLQKSWEDVALEVHTELIKGGIDPVSYYPFDLIYAGVEVTRSFVNDLTLRDFKNIILIRQSPRGLDIAIAPFDPAFFHNDVQPGWKRSGDFKNILNQLYVTVANSGMPQLNLLIANQPEKGVLTSPLTGKRAEYFSLSVDGTKTAVPHFGEPLLDQELRAVLDREYPFDYELVDPGVDEEELKKQGFQFVLYYVHSSGETVRQFLDYETEEDSDVYATITYRNGKSEVLPLPIEQRVYKYYLKHLISGTTYLGSEWDAGTTWRQALINHIESFVNGTQR